MDDRLTRKVAVRWGVGLWAVGIEAFVVGLPWAVRSRMPERLATHWDSRADAPDGSMPYWAATVVPGLVWAVLVLAVSIVLVVRGRGAASTGSRAKAGAVAALLASGVGLAGAQVSIVLANLDRTDWRQAGSPAPGVLMVLAAAVPAGILGWLLARAPARPSGNL